MDLLLDTKTMLIALVIGHLFTVVLISSYWRSNSRDTTFNIFFLSKCIQAAAWLLMGLRGVIPDLFTVSVANSLQIIGSGFESVAILKLASPSKPIFKRFYIGFTVAYLVSFYIIVLFYNYEDIRIFWASMAIAILAILPAYRLIQEKCSTLLMKLMGVLYYLVAISFTLRGFVAIISEKQMSLFIPGFLQTLSFLAIYLVMILGNIGFILILKERADAELIHMAFYDDLTQALNRRTFVERAKKALAQCAKEKEHLSFVLFDIDHFKHFNDSYGHEIGDRILQNLAKQVNESLDSESLFGRYGGDEFAILLTGLDRDESVKKLEQMTDLIALAEIPGVPEKYSISIGVITLIPDKLTKLESLYVCCDKVLYESKHKGKNCISYGEFQEAPAY